jgi:malate dehydrogenase
VSYLTDEKIAVLGAAGAIGSNLAQTLVASNTASQICMYDPFAQGLEGAAEELYHCGFSNADITWTSDISEALSGASYVITSGGAPRKEGMTREDLRRDNAKIAKQLGIDIKEHAPDAKFVIVIFNPADITGLTTLVHSGLPSTRVSTLAALDSTRLQSALAQHFGVLQSKVTGCRTYGGHGEQMAVFLGGIQIDGTSLGDVLGGSEVNDKSLSDDEWKDIKEKVTQGGARIIQLRSRSSFQSPSQQSVFMLRGVLGESYEWPSGCYLNGEGFEKIMMAMPAKLSDAGAEWSMPEGSADDIKMLRSSYEHLVALRDQTIEDGILPPLSEWSSVNPNL